METSPRQFDTTTESFERDVLERSDEVLVAVDFWAPWCGPCRFLGPVLEGLVEGLFKDRVVLARVNTDEQPALAAQFQIRGIPAVKLFRRRRMVAEFVGALPEAQVAEVFQRLMPTRADEAVEEALALESSGDLAAAEARLREAVAEERLHPLGWLALGRVLEARGALEEALDCLRRVTGGGPEEHEAASRTASLALRIEAAAFGDEAALRGRVEADPRDVEARYGLGLLLAARGEHRAALEQLLEVVRLDRRFRDDAGRRAMLAVFEAAGTRSELSDEFRARLASALY